MRNLVLIGAVLCLILSGGGCAIVPLHGGPFLHGYEQPVDYTYHHHPYGYYPYPPYPYVYRPYSYHSYGYDPPGVIGHDSGIRRQRNSIPWSHGYPPHRDYGP